MRRRRRRRHRRDADAQGDGHARQHRPLQEAGVTVPDELPPDTLQTRDIVKGKGPKAKKGDTVSMQYVGLAWSTGVEFDASWDRGEPFTFKLGTGNVIKGWDEGIPGCRRAAGAS